MILSRISMAGYQAEGKKMDDDTTQKFSMQIPESNTKYFPQNNANRSTKILK